MTAALSIRRLLIVCAACFVAALALQSGNAAASGIGLTYNNFEYGSAQVGVTCYGRYVHYRSDAFVTAGYGTWTLPEVQFYIGYDVIRNGRWVYAGEALPWTRAGGGGQFSLNLPSGEFFRLWTLYAVRIGNGWNYSNWQLEVFNGQGLDFCRV